MPSASETPARPSQKRPADSPVAEPPPGKKRLRVETVKVATPVKTPSNKRRGKGPAATPVKAVKAPTPDAEEEEDVMDDEPAVPPVVKKTPLPKGFVLKVSGGNVQSIEEV